MLLAALLTAAIAFGGAWKYCDQVPELLAGISVPGWLAIVACALGCYGLDYLRLRSLLSVLDHPLSLRAGLQATTVSEFASIVTPTAELHIPATVYVLARKGIPVPIGTAAVVSKTLYMLLWVAVCALAVLLMADRAALPAWVLDNLPWCVVPVALIVAFFVAVVFFAVPLHRWTQARLQAGALPRWKHAVLNWLGKSTEALATIGKSTHRMHLLTHVYSLGYIFAYCLSGYCIARALGMDMGCGQALTVFSLSLMVTYMGVVPGSIGVTEVATAYLLDASLSPRSLAIAILLRVLTRYVALLPGAFFFFRIVWHHGLEKLVRQERTATVQARNDVA